MSARDSRRSLGDSIVMGEDREEGIGRALRIVALVSGGLVIILVSVGIALAILSTMSVFEVTNVEANETEHVKSEDIVQLANVPEGTTLLRVDSDLITKNIQRNPWAYSVEIQRVFPDTLRLDVKERKLGAVVAMGSGGIAWLMGDDGVWIEPLKLKVDQSESANDEALRQAASLGVVLISDVPSSVRPVAGTHTTDKAIEAAFSIAGQLTDAFKSQIVCYSASSEDDISCIMSNGVEVSLGSDSEIRTKEAVARRIMEEYSGQVTYINVRIPSRPTYRHIDSKYVREGTGAIGSDKEQDTDESLLDQDIQNTDEQATGEDQNTEETEHTQSYDEESYDGYYVEDSEGWDYDYGYDYSYGYDYDDGYSTDEYTDYTEDYTDYGY